MHTKDLCGLAFEHIFQQNVNNLTRQPANVKLSSVPSNASTYFGFSVSEDATCQTTFPSPIFRVLPTPGSGMLFGLLFGCSDLCLDSLERRWNLGNAARPLNASCGVLIFLHEVVHESEALSGGLSDKGSFITHSTDHTHILSSYLPRWRRRCCVQGRLVKGHICWFSCVCLTLWRRFGICGPRLCRTSILFMSYWALNPSLFI